MSICATSLLGFAVRQVFVFVFVFFLPVMLPSVIPKLPRDLPVRGFPAVWKRLPPRDGSLSLTLLSLFLSFIFCPTSFQREWAAFLGAWCPPPGFRSCFVEVAQHSNDLLMNLWGRKWSPHPIPPPSWDHPSGAPLDPRIEPVGLLHWQVESLPLCHLGSA